MRIIILTIFCLLEIPNAFALSKRGFPVDDQWMDWAITAASRIKFSALVSSLGISELREPTRPLEGIWSPSPPDRLDRVDYLTKTIGIEHVGYKQFKAHIFGLF